MVIFPFKVFQTKGKTKRRFKNQWNQFWGGVEGRHTPATLCVELPPWKCFRMPSTVWTDGSLVCCQSRRCRNHKLCLWTAEKSCLFHQALLCWSKLLRNYQLFPNLKFKIYSCRLFKLKWIYFFQIHLNSTLIILYKWHKQHQKSK